MTKQDELIVLRDGEPVGTLTKTSQGSRFEYLENVTQSVALHLPLEGVQTTGVFNLPSFFAGLLPEGKLLVAYQNRHPRVALDDMYAVLADTAYDAIGDVTIRGERELPKVDLEEAANALTNDFDNMEIFAIPGVQPKMSLGTQIKLTRVSMQKSAYLLKAGVDTYPNLVENEAVTMDLARRCGIDAAKTRIAHGCLLVTRFDRIYDESESRLRQVHVEDMIQVLNLYNISKYTIDFSQLMAAGYSLNRNASVPLRMLEIYLFSYLIGNGDLHAKNISVMRVSRDRPWEVTPPYDLVCTQLYPSLESGMALTLDGVRSKFTRRNFLRASTPFQIPERSVDAMIDRLIHRLSKNLDRLDQMPFPTETVVEQKRRIEKRMKLLEKRQVA